MEYRDDIILLLGLFYSTGAEQRLVSLSISVRSVFRFPTIPSRGFYFFLSEIHPRDITEKSFPLAKRVSPFGVSFVTSTGRSIISIKKKKMYNALPPRFSSSYPRRNVEIFVRLENRRTEKNVLPRRKFRKIKKREKYWSKSPGGYRENRPVNLNSNASLAVCTRTRTALGRTYVSHKQKKPKKKKKTTKVGQ